MNKAGLVSLGAVHTHTHTSRLLEKNNKIKIDNRITVKPEYGKI